MASEVASTGIITPALLESAVRSKIAGVTHVQAEDLSDGCGAKFSLLVVSSEFAGKPLLQQQRLVNTNLKEEISRMHAITLKTKTPEQWEKIQAESASTGGSVAVFAPAPACAPSACASSSSAADSACGHSHDHGHGHAHEHVHGPSCGH
jgi:stress-induced morphogen